jgi:hypothetical protein
MSRKDDQADLARIPARLREALARNPHDRSALAALAALVRAVDSARRAARRRRDREHPPEYGYKSDGTPVTRKEFLAALNRAVKRVYDIDLPPNYAGVPDDPPDSDP